jgi:GntR family transcriptional regulator, transcriptional repressor for pyruvate dehydrogenase complex
MRDYDSLIKPIESRRTFEEVSNRIKELIFSGELKPGDRLPSETALAQLFQVGRQSVREALRVLERSGFITVKAGVKGGPIIEDTLHRKMAALFLDASRFNRVSLDDYTSALFAIDTSCIDFIFRNADEADIGALRDNIARARERLQLNIPAFDENINFHRLLAKATKNYVFAIIMESVLAVLSDFRSKLTPHAGAEPSRKITDLHEQIVNAIEAKEKTEIAALIEKDLAISKEILTSRPRTKSARARADYRGSGGDEGDKVG